MCKLPKVDHFPPGTPVFHIAYPSRYYGVFACSDYVDNMSTVRGFSPNWPTLYWYGYRHNLRLYV